MNRLTKVHNNGVVTHATIVSDPNKKWDDNHIQIIWNKNLFYYVQGWNSVEDECQVEEDIKHYRAVYFNDIMIVKNGKVYPTKKKWWQFWR